MKTTTAVLLARRPEHTFVADDLALGEIELPAGASLETGQTREELGQLEGRAYKPASPSSWGGWSGDTTEDRAKFEWVVRADAGVVLCLTPAGRKLFKRTMQLIAQRNDEIFGCLNVREQATLSALFDRLIAHARPQGQAD